MTATQDPMIFNPEILQWALDVEGCTPEELSRKLKIPIDEINNLLTTKNEIQLKMLKEIASYLKFPSTMFFLPKPPYESRLSYRKIPGTPVDKPTKNTLKAIRQAYYMQSISKELLAVNEYDNLEPNTDRFSIQDSTAEAAHAQRKKLGFESINASAPNEMQKRYTHMYNGLVKKIEELNIFVHQILMPKDEVRGFTLIDSLPRVIAVNANDSDAPKIFTLLHEYAHVLLKDTDNVCFPNYSLGGVRSNQTERWCNDFAGSFLMPEEEFKEKLKKLEEIEPNPKKIITKLAKHFYSSRHAVLVRMEKLGIKTAQSYKDYFDEMKNIELFPHRRISNTKNQTEEEKNQKKRAAEITKCLNRRGRKLINLVLESNDKGFVTSDDIIDYLDLNPNYLDDLEKTL